MATRTLPALPAARPLAARNILHQAWTMTVTMVRARQTRQLLAEMDDRMLADVGASRSDAMMEGARPFWVVSSRRR